MARATFFWLSFLVFHSFIHSFFLFQCGIFGDLGQQRSQNNSHNYPEHEDHEEENDSVRWARLTIFLNLTDSGIFLVLYVLFICVVHLRAVQISHTKTEMKRFEQWDATLTPYRIPRARLNSLTRDENTLELRSCRGTNGLSAVNFHDYPTISRHSTNIPPYYDNFAFKY